MHDNSKREGIQYTGVNGQYTVITAEEAAASRAAASQEFDESEDAKVLKERIAKLGESADAARAELKKINQSISSAGDAISNAEKGIETVAKRRTALEVEELNKRAAAERKTAEERIAQKKKLALADIELEKQRSISGGMSSEEASGIAAEKAAMVEIAAEEERLAAKTAALAKRRAQAESDEASGRAEAEKTVLAGIAAEEEKLQAETEALAKRRAAAEAEAQNRRVAAEKKAAQEKAEIDKRSAAEQARRDRAQLTERIHSVQEANKKELDEIDKKIAAERQKAAEWERDAQKARDAAQGGGAGFSDWQRAERGGGKEERRQRRMQEAAERRARDTIRDLERREKQQRGGLNADQQRRLDAARRFIAMQDPKNNPAAKKVEELEKQRLDAINKTTTAVTDLKKTIEKLTV